MIITQQSFTSNVLISEPASLAPSLTVPGQVMPLAEVIARYTRGQSVQVFSSDTEDIPVGFERLDRIERAQALLDTRRKVSSTRAKLQSEQDAKLKHDEATPPSAAIIIP